MSSENQTPDLIDLIRLNELALGYLVLHCPVDLRDSQTLDTIDRLRRSIGAKSALFGRRVKVPALARETPPSGLLRAYTHHLEKPLQLRSVILQVGSVGMRS